MSAATRMTTSSRTGKSRSERGLAGPGGAVGPADTPIRGTGIVVLALFVRRQLRTAHPLIRMSFFRNPTFCLTNAILAAIIFGFFGGYLLTPIYLETALGITLSVTSLIMVFRPLFVSLASPVWVRLPGNWPRRGPVVGGLLSLMSMCVFALGASVHLVGAFIAGLVLNLLGVDVNSGGYWFTFFVALGGAIVLLWLGRLARRR